MEWVPSFARTIRGLGGSDFPGTVQGFKPSIFQDLRASERADRRAKERGLLVRGQRAFDGLNVSRAGTVAQLTARPQDGLWARGSKTCSSGASIGPRTRDRPWLRFRRNPGCSVVLIMCSSPSLSCDARDVGKLPAQVAVLCLSGRNWPAST